MFITMLITIAKTYFNGKEFENQAGDMDLIPGSGRSPGGRNNNLIQNSCLGNPMYRGA